jgi:1,4-dihydroxy-2-naphthoate octaprenyltransferase
MSQPAAASLRSADSVSSSPGSLLDNWRQIIATREPARGSRDGRRVALALITRACVFSMTHHLGADRRVARRRDRAARHWGYFALALVGLVLAHADQQHDQRLLRHDRRRRHRELRRGRSTRRTALLESHLEGRPDRDDRRVQSRRPRDRRVARVARGWPVAAFALAGLFISVFYVAPPLKLKHHGLGEPGVFVVWGPLMIGGTYYVTAGTLPSVDLARVRCRTRSS